MYLLETKEIAPAGAPTGRSQQFFVLGADDKGACFFICCFASFFFLFSALRPSSTRNSFLSHT
jgi:hypothetical protein